MSAFEVPNADLPEAGARRPLLLAGLSVALLVPLLVTPVLPLADLYNHVARFYILSRLGGDPFLAQHYAENWRILPNLGFDYIGIALLRILTPQQLAKAIVAMIVLAQFGGTLCLNRALTGRINGWTIVLAAALCYSFVLGWGFVNYLMGAALMLWALALWVWLRRRPALATLCCSVVAVVVFLSHGLAFGFYGMALGGIELGLWFNRSPRRWRDLASGAGLLAVQAIVPMVLFLQSPTSQRPTGGVPADHHAPAVVEAASLAERAWSRVSGRLEGIVRVADTPWNALDAVLFVATVAVLALALLRGWIAVSRAAVPALALAAVMVFVIPNGLFGAAYLSERAALLLAVLFAASLRQGNGSPPGAGIGWSVLTAIAGLRLMAVILGWSAYRQGYDDYRQVAEKLAPRSVLAWVLVLGDDLRDGLNPRCNMYPTLAVVDRQVATHLFANPAQQPITMKGRVLTLSTNVEIPLTAQQNADFRRTGYPRHYYDDRVAQASDPRFADYLMICGADRLRRRLPANLELLSARGNLSLYRVR